MPSTYCDITQILFAYQMAYQCVCYLLSQPHDQKIKASSQSHAAWSHKIKGVTKVHWEVCSFGGSYITCIAYRGVAVLLGYRAVQGKQRLISSMTQTKTEQVSPEPSNGISLFDYIANYNLIK